MNKSVIVCALGSLCALAPAVQAQEAGRVLSSVPVIQQVAVPRQVCNQQQVEVQSAPSGAGAAIGAVAGGAVGNAIGNGSGRAVATVVGLIGGAMLGNNIERPTSGLQNVQSCSTQTFYENRTVGYNVTYEFAGKQYQVQMPNDPGPTVRLQITPMSAAPSEALPVAAPQPIAQPDYGQPAYGQPVYGQPIYGQPIYGQPPVYTVAPVVVAAAPVVAYPYYRPAYQPYYPPVGVSLNFGYSRGWGGHRHWR